MNKNTYAIYTRTEAIKQQIALPLIALMVRQDITQLLKQKGLSIDAQNIKIWVDSFTSYSTDKSKLPTGYMSNARMLSLSIQSIAAKLGLGIDPRRPSDLTPKYRQDGDLHQSDYGNIVRMLLDIERHGGWLIKHLSNPNLLPQESGVAYVLRIQQTRVAVNNKTAKYLYETDCDSFQEARGEGSAFITRTLFEVSDLLHAYQARMTEAPRVGGTLNMNHEFNDGNWTYRTTIGIKCIKA